MILKLLYPQWFYIVIAGTDIGHEWLHMILPISNVGLKITSAYRCKLRRHKHIDEPEKK
jgi:hypothetical protein